MIMNMFSLSENEYNTLESVCNQIDLVVGLLCAKGADSSLIDAAGLLAFLSKQTEEMRAVRRSLDTRYEAQREEGQLNWLHWCYALKIASGDSIHTPSGSEKFVLEGLAKAATIDEGMSSVLTQWLEIMDKQKPAPAPTEQPKKPAQRKRDKLAAKTLEVVS
jgi:hypothetical protein